jgi:hypothetical protein
MINYKLKIGKTEKIVRLYEKCEDTDAQIVLCSLISKAKFKEL